MHWTTCSTTTTPVSAPSPRTSLTWLLKTDKYGNKHANARRLGIMYLIWNDKIWSSSQAADGWREYNGSNPHTDHIHFSLSWAGAHQETSWWQWEEPDTLATA